MSEAMTHGKVHELRMMPRPRGASIGAAQTGHTRVFLFFTGFFGRCEPSSGTIFQSSPMSGSYAP